MAVFLVNIGDHLPITAQAGLAFQRQVIVADVALGPQFGYHFVTCGGVCKHAVLPNLLAEHFRVRAAEQFQYIGIGIGDLASLPVEDQYAVLGGFKEPAEADLGGAQ